MNSKASGFQTLSPLLGSLLMRTPNHGHVTSCVEEAYSSLTNTFCAGAMYPVRRARLLHNKINTGEFYPQSGEEKQFAKTKYLKRKQSNDVAFSKLSFRDQKLILEARVVKRLKKKTRTAKLDPHVFEELLGFTRDRQRDVQVMKQGADAALDFARRVNATKEHVTYKGSSIHDFGGNALARLEDLIAFVVGISTSSNFLNFLSMTHLYLRTFFTEPISLRIIDLIRDNFCVAKEFLVERAGVYNWTSQSGDDADKIEEQFEMMKNLMKNWKQHKHCDFTKHACNIVNILVTFGFFPALKDNPVELNGFRLFQAKVWDVQKDSVDFTEMVLDTAVFFLERGYAAIKTGDLSLLLYEDGESLLLEREYALLVSALPLLEAGRLDGLEKFHESIIDQQDYEVRLEKLIAKFSGMLKTEKHPHMRNTLTNKLVVLSKVRTALILCQKTSCIREKPFGVLIHGGSAVGKSMVNTIILKVLLSANGFNSSKEHIVTLNDSDKYQSDYSAVHTAVTMDDFGNTRAEHYEACPTNKIIDFLNNVPKAALKADVESKGNVMIQPKIVTVTTNVKELLAGAFSNEPVSILRRFNVVLDVFLRDEWTDKETGGPKESMMSGLFMPDAWAINVERVQIVRREGRKDEYKFVTIKAKASISEALDIMKTMTVSHFASQKNFVKIVEEMYDLDLCEHFFPPTECPHCACAHEHKLDAHTLEEPDAVEETFSIDEPSVFNWADTDLLRRTCASLVNPIDYAESLRDTVSQWYVDRGLDGPIDHISGACNTLMEAFERHKQTVLAVTLGSVSVGVTLYTIHRIYKAMAMLNQHGNEVSVPVLLDDDAPSPWKKLIVEKIPKQLKSSTATVQELSGKVAKHLGHVFVIDRERGVRRRCDIMPMRNNYWLAPSHMFDDKEYLIEIQTTARDVFGKNPTQLVGPENWTRIPDTDFILLCLTSGGDVADFGAFLPTSPHDYRGVFAEGIFKDDQGDVDVCRFKLLESRMIESKKAKFYGVVYHYPRPTFEGLCMMPLITCTRGPVLVGFHLAGKTDTTYGAAGTLLLSQLEEAIVVLRGKGALECHSSGEMTTQKYGIDFSPIDSAPPKSAVKYLEDSVEGVQPVGICFGEHPLGTRTFVSGVQKSPISDSVFRHTGLSRIHGRPKGMNSWTHWQRDLALMTIPRGQFRPSIMKLARDDFTNMVSDFFVRRPDMLELVHPYAKDCVLAGIDGVNSVARIDLSTSMGFPINKQKKNFIHESERKVPGINCPLDIDDEFWSEVERMEECLANGERVFTVFRANLKDEPTKFTKDKVRVFAGCEFAFLCLARKYFLSVIRVIQSNWHEFECAVGINAHGKDWTKLAEVLTKFGKERMIAGDYAAFDKTAAPEAMFAAFEQLIQIAELAGYTPRQLMIMRGIATEISLPIYEFNGVLLQMLGSNPSGHPLTVIINNIMNSLYLRYAYYVIHEGENVKPFNEVISLMCFGDDNVMGVSDEERKFNHTRVSDELAKVGIKYTMADKKAASIPYIPLSEVSFLKRNFIWSDDVNEYVAPIEEDSISKSLHNYIKRRGADVLPEVIAADAIKNAQREYFRHGRELYTSRMAQLELVRDECDLGVYVGDILSYDEAVSQYLEASLKTKTPTEDEPDLFCFD